MYFYFLLLQSTVDAAAGNDPYSILPTVVSSGITALITFLITNSRKGSERLEMEVKELMSFKSTVQAELAIIKTDSKHVDQKLTDMNTTLKTLLEKIEEVREHLPIKPPRRGGTG